jgi:hypothetical protein
MNHTLIQSSAIFYVFLFSRVSGGGSRYFNDPCCWIMLYSSTT